MNYDKYAEENKVVRSGYGDRWSAVGALSAVRAYTIYLFSFTLPCIYK